MESVKISVLNALLDESKRHIYFTNQQDRSEDGETVKYYRHPEMAENIFFQVTYTEDSYGGDDRIVAMKFVEGKPKTITVYEPINS